MMQNAPRVAHTRPGHNEARALDFIKLHRLLGCGCRYDVIPFADDVTGALHRRGLLVKQVRMALVNLARFDRHRAVEIYRERLELAGAEQLIQMIEDLLGASDGKGGDQDARLAVHSVLDDRPELGESFLQRFVIAVTVSGFHEDDVGAFEGHWVPE